LKKRGCVAGQSRFVFCLDTDNAPMHPLGLPATEAEIIDKKIGNFPLELLFFPICKTSTEKSVVTFLPVPRPT
jgi:hypothetical protein